MYINIFKNKLVFFLLIIVLLTSFLRFYKVTQIPPSLSWDEAAVGYNAWTIANYGKDEWGEKFPLVFKSFEDVKKPVNVYVTSFFILLFGLNEFATRLPAILFGIFNTILIFFLARKIFKKEIIGLLSSFFFAISPYNIHFSRFNHEANIALFLFMAGVLLFIHATELKRNILLLPSGLLFLLSMLSYNAALIVVPILFFVLILLNFKKILKPKALIALFLPVLLFVLLVLKEPALLGSSRASQVSYTDGEISQTQVYKITNNLFISKILIVLNQYFYYFSPNYLFIVGDKNPRLSLQGVGEFYLLDALLVIVGFINLIRQKDRWPLFIVLWALIAPVAGSITKEAPHAARGMFMMGSFQIVAAYGAYIFLDSIKKRQLKIPALGLFLIIYLSFCLFSLNNYFNNYANNYSHDWQYGMKQIVEYVEAHPEYNEVYMTNVRSQPYIFFLYYLKTPISNYLNEVEYNHTESRSYNLVFRFDRYFFEWEVLDSAPISGKVYIISSSEYDGLKYKPKFKVKKTINNPNGTVAFYIVSVS